MLNKYRKVDAVLLGVIFALLLIGVIMTYSSSAVKGYLYYDDPYHYFKAELVWVGLGLVAMTAGLLIDWRFLYKWAKPILYAALLLLVLVKIPGIGRTVNGATRWIGLGPLSIQPSEVIKLAMVLVMARFLAANPYNIKSFRKGIIPSLALLGIVCGLIMLQPDLGTTLVIAATVFFMLLAVGANLWIWPAGVCRSRIVVAAIICGPYRMRTIFAFLIRGPILQARVPDHSIAAGAWAGGLFGLAWGKAARNSSTYPRIIRILSLR